MSLISWIKRKFSKPEVATVSEPVNENLVSEPLYGKINQFIFIREITKSFGKINLSQVEEFLFLLREWNSTKPSDDIRHFAYILATIWHETAKTMLPIAEYGKGKGRKYGKPDPVTGKIYYGRGYVQLTWAENYKKMSKILGYDLYNNPDLALNTMIAWDILIEGMLSRASFKGDFTGVSLENFFNKKKNDPIGARKIINGNDKAELIAGYHYKFLHALYLATITEETK